ncbi:MAG: sensor histidine kinase, partial [Candidatus Hodarchaeales archaeon]
MPRVLHVDDESDFLEMTASYLQSEDIDIISVQSCREAFQVLANEKIDAIISDYQIPDMDGLSFLDHLRTGGNDIPFIMLTGRGREEVAIRALNLGADYYLMKGLEVESLFNELVHIIHKTVSHVETEKRLKKVMNALEQSMDILEKSFSEVEERNVELEEFFYAVLHELPGPIVTINGYLTLLQNDLSGGKIDQLDSYIERARKTVTRMEQRLNALENLVSIKRNQRHPGWVSINDLVQDIVETVPELSNQHVSLVIEPDLPKVYGDRFQIHLLLENLLTNALKFKGEDRDLSIKIGCKTDQNKSIFFIRDNGKGLDPRDHERIFNLFERLNPEIPGTGTGLTIVRKIVQAHGGRIWVESDGIDCGSTFYFTFVEESQTSRFRVFEKGMQVNGTTIMAIVDGMGPIARLTKIFFKRVGLPENIVSDTEHWYSQQQWLDAFRLVSEKVGEKSLYNIGKSIPENAQFPSNVVDIESALSSIDIAYHMNHRNNKGEVLFDPSRPESEIMLEGIGHYGYEKITGENKVIMV